MPSAVCTPLPVRAVELNVREQGATHLMPLSMVSLMMWMRPVVRSGQAHSNSMSCDVMARSCAELREDPDDDDDDVEELLDEELLGRFSGAAGQSGTRAKVCSMGAAGCWVIAACMTPIAKRRASLTARSGALPEIVFHGMSKVLLARVTMRRKQMTLTLYVAALRIFSPS